MASFIEHININNFKSIRECQIDGCRRINLIIGKPNVGKSNLLEALSLFSLPFLRENRLKSITNFIRLENETELFYRGNYEIPVRVTTNIGELELVHFKQEGMRY